MSASLVGSEMCIRDRQHSVRTTAGSPSATSGARCNCSSVAQAWRSGSSTRSSQKALSRHLNGMAGAPSR
eukprot:8325316-Alexandrium_andersonii.AAC.1